MPGASPRRGPRVVRLWWRCSLCRRRFDTFGVDHADPEDRRAAASEALAHLEGRHGRRLERLADAAALLVPAGRTTRVIRRDLISPFPGPSAS